ncbi:MAG TPA: MMPL family transporter [Candidatus Saccharimonadales bacterium]|nr:MMPL family transporter [Candidatus Saccharimonadales bacterium]
MFGKIATFSVRFRWLIIIAWIVAVPLLNHYLPSITSVSKTDNSQFLPKNSPTQEAVNLESVFQGKSTVGRGIIVASRASGPLTPADQTAIEQVAQTVRHDKDVSVVRNLGVSKDGQAVQLFVGFSGSGFGNESTDFVNQVRAQLKQAAPPGLQFNFTGQIPQAVDADKANSHGRNSTEIYTVILIIVLLLVVFRAALAPIITLVPAMLALLVSQPLIAESSKAGVQVSPITEILLIVLILGAGTDYGLFLVFRMREELRKGFQPKEAVVKALSRVGESITFSAATVASALLCLLLASFGIYSGLGPALAIGLGVMLLAALTFLPATLAILGRSVYWPSKTAKRELKIGLWGRLADWAIERPWLTLTVGMVIFFGLSLGVIGYKTVGFTNSTTTTTNDSSIGQNVIATHFPVASTNPADVLFVFSRSIWNNLSVVQKADQQLVASSQFKAVSGPFNVNGLTITPEQLAAAHARGGTGPLAQTESQFISPDGKTVRFEVVIKAGAPGSSAALNATPAIRSTITGIANHVGASQAQLYGQDSSAYDISHVANSDLKHIIPLVLIVIAVLLAIMLRSLVAPWYLIVTVGLSYLASLGFAMIVFVHIGGDDGLNFVLPFMMFVFSMALGEDYNILVMSRIREEAEAKVTLKSAVAKAVGITGTTVTSAGLILAGTFAIFGLEGGSRQFQEIGYAIAFGILLDTFFVRTLFVPAIVALLGRWNWWPGALYRRSS